MLGGRSEYEIHSKIFECFFFSYLEIFYKTWKKSFRIMIFFSVCVYSDAHDNSRIEGRSGFVLMTKCLYLQKKKKDFKLFSVRISEWKYRKSEISNCFMRIYWTVIANELKFHPQIYINKLHFCAKFQSYSPYYYCWPFELLLE